MINNKKKLNIYLTIFILLVILTSVMFLSLRNNKIKNINLNYHNNYRKNSKKNEEIKSIMVKPINKDDNYQGNLDAPVQLIIYCDFECPFCLRFLDTINKVKEEFKDKVVIAYRHYILDTHENSFSAALASECAAEQGKFWDMHDKLFQDNNENNFNIDEFKKDAQDLGLEKLKFENCLENEKYKDKIKSQMEEAKNIGVIGTPHIFINGENVIGAYPFEDFIFSNGDKEQGVKNIILKYIK